MSGISFTVRPPSAPHRPSPLGNGHRSGPPSRRLFEEAGPDDDEDEYGHRRERRYRNEDRGSSRSSRGPDREEKPLVIPALPNRDWRQTVQKRTPSYRPESRQQDGEIVTHERVGDEPQRSGLRHVFKSEAVIATTSNGTTEVKSEVVVETNGESSTPAKTEPMTLEQQALAELLAGGSSRESAAEKAQRDLVIAMEEGKDMTEEDAYKRDVEDLPEESTLEDYDAIPVSAFGLAMVRGMGYDPKSSTNTVIHEPKRRPQLLGLGATPMDPTIKPTHAKHSSAKVKQAERRAKTGRGFNASNLLVKKEVESDREPSSSRGGSRRTSPGSDGSRRRRRDDDYDERDRKRERNGDSRSRDFEYDSERDRDRERHRDRERDRERDRDRARDWDRTPETEEARARRKERERARDRERDGRSEYETEEERARRKAKERERRDREGYENGDDRRRRD